MLQLDTNLLNSKQKLTEINQLEKWRDDGFIQIIFSDISHQEALDSQQSRLVKKANQQIYTINEDEGEREGNAVYKNIRSILNDGNPDLTKFDNDAKIINEAYKYGAILVTNDGGSKSQKGGILGHRQLLAPYLTILNPMEAVEFIKTKIK